MMEPENSTHRLHEEANVRVFAGPDDTGSDGDIAIIGMACRFPGASDHGQFWRNLVSGVNSIKEIPSTRWDLAKYYSRDGGEGKSQSKWCGLVDDIDQFDASFFNISPREACEMDPQQRLLLEETHHCIEDAGIALQDLQTHRTGVFVGCATGDYQQISSSDEIKKDSYAVLGNYKSVLSNRISYFFNFTGPSITMDTACASSLVALHEAVKSLQTGECDYAIVGGVNANVHPWKYVIISQANMLSRDGQCRTFDMNANGYVPGDGVGVVLLQRSHHAVRLRNRILGNVKATAVNHNGKSVSITAPSINAQRELIRTVYRKSGISPRTVTYVEAHGTGTSLGDPIEVEALNQAFSAYTEDKGFCHIGSVKSNIGHLEGAAGMAGLLKVLLMMRNRWIPKTLHSEILNPIIDFANTPFVPAQQSCEWRRIRPSIPLRASVSAFGFSGSNAHVLIEEPSAANEDNRQSGEQRPDSFPRLFTVSARSAKSLKRLIDRWKAFAETDEFEAIPLRDLCATLLNSRSRFEYRFGFAIQNKDDVKRRLNEFEAASKSKPARWNLRIGEFAITGYDEIRPVLNEFAVLRTELDMLLDQVDQQVLQSGSFRDQFRKERWGDCERAANELLFGYAYVSTLMKLGFHPAVVSSIGRGVYLACVVSGMTTLASMIKALISGDPASISLDWPRIPLYDGVNHKEIRSCDLTPQYLKTLRDSVEVLPEEVDGHIRYCKLLLGHQFTFSKYLEEWMIASAQAGLNIRTLLENGGSGPPAICSQDQRICFVVAASNAIHRVKAKWQLPEQTKIASPFLRELVALINDEVLTKEDFVQLVGDPRVSYQPILDSMRRAMDGAGVRKEYRILIENSRRVRPIPDTADWLRLSEETKHADPLPGAMNRVSIGLDGAEAGGHTLQVLVPAPIAHLREEVLLKLWLAGVPVHWKGLIDGLSYSKPPLPLYEFDRQKYWVEVKDDRGPLAQFQVVSSASKPVSILHPLVQHTAPGSQLHFTSTFDGRELFLSDHKVDGCSVLPGAAYIEMVRKACEIATGARIDAMSGLSFTSVVWVQPIHVADKPQTVHIQLKPNGDDSFGYEVFSGSEALPGGLVLHAQGTVRARALDAIPRLDLPGLQRETHLRRLSPAELYRRYQAAGIDYGPGHRGVCEMRLLADQALAMISLPSSVALTASDFVLHPSIVDSALQAALAMQWIADPDSTSQSEAQSPMMPFSVESIDVFARTRTPMWALSRFADDKRQSTGDLRSLDIDLCDESGNVCMRFKRLLARRAHENRATTKGRDRHSLSQAHDSLSAPIVVTPVWTPFHPVLNDASVIDRSCRVLAFGAEEYLMPALERIFTNCMFFETAADWTERSIFERLRDYGTIDQVVWFDADGTSGPVSDQGVIDRQRCGVFRLFNLIKAVLQLGYAAREMVWTICTAQTFAVETGDRVDPTHASIHGLVGSMAKEFPNWHIRMIDLGSCCELPNVVFDIPTNPSGNPIAYRRGQWFRREFFPVRKLSGEEKRLRRTGAYVVIGGAGGIGSEWSRWMIERYQAQMIWIGRRQKDVSVQRQIHELEAFGPPPYYICADATNPESLRAAYDEIKTRFSKINGVVHSAIVLKDSSLANMTQEQFAASLEANVDACVRLAQVFSPEDLDFVLFFSSIQSFCMFAGQSNYAAGCTFKDAFATRLRQDWPCVVKVVNWGYWGSVGVVAGDFYRESMALKGLGSIEPAEGFELLERFIDGPMDQVAILKALRSGVIDGLREDEWLTADFGNDASREEMQAPDSVFASPLDQDKTESNTFARDTIPSFIEKVRRRLQAQPVAEVSPPRDEDMETLLLELLWGTLRSLGLFRGERTRSSEAVATLKLSGGRARWMEESIRQFLAAGFLESGGSFLAVKRPGPDLEGLWKRWDEAKSSQSVDTFLKTQFNLAEACLRGLPAVLKDARPATGVLFPNGSMELVEPFFKNDPVAAFCNDIVARVVVAFLEERLAGDPSARIRLLEIGAGTGATTAALLPRLSPYEPHIESYCFTDISKAFLLHADKEFAPRASYLTTALFDVEKPIAGQPAGGRTYDLVLATNVLHATKNIRQTLRNVKAALKKHGLLVLNELSRNTLFIHLTFGLLDGWWLYEDEVLRIPGSPVLTPETWAKVLRGEGFHQVLFPVPSAVQLGQQIVVAESDGIVGQYQAVAMPSERATPEPKMLSRPIAKTMDSSGAFRRSFQDKCLELLRKQIASCLKMQPHQIDATQPFEQYGVDSILVVQLTNSLRKTFPDISTTLFFEVQNLNGLVDRLIQTHRQTLSELVECPEEEAIRTVLQESPADRQAAPVSPFISHLSPPRPAAAVDRDDPGRPSYRLDEVAIIGLSGRYPGAGDMDEFWQLLRTGECSVSEVPADRWDWRAYYDERKGTSGRSCTRWGGFLKDVDKFDPLFFRIAPREAEKMDPQERLFLEMAHASIEDAGYTPASLSGSRKVGVFVGVMNSTYAPIPRYWSIANRVSHCFDFHGPSLAVDTACSSSLTAIHLAMESLHSGMSECAIAGGVNLILHPRHIVGLNEMTMLSSGRECRAFGDQADGFVDAEGVGAVVLKPARKAIADGDHIYGILKASSLNAAGKSNGYTVPNPNTQADLIAEALDRANVDPASVGYVEAHGTGTALGDPIEISALTQAFEKARHGRPPVDNGGARCAIGSVKSNIGHAESAAGIAGLTKVLLQMKHGELVPSLHAEVLNPHVDFEHTPFAVQRRLEPWKRPTLTVGAKTVCLPRIAGVSSFGAGGSNAHLIVEEYKEPRESAAPAIEGKPALIILSAMNEDRLYEAVRKLHAFLAGRLTANPASAPDLQSLAYTLQVGRETMKERLGLVVTSLAELTEKLGRHLEDPSRAGDVRRGSVVLDGETSALFGDEVAMTEIARDWMRQGRFARLLGLWTKGFDIDWNTLYGDIRPRRVSLPTYSFARERYWRRPDDTFAPGSPAGAAPRIHPLLHENVSTPDEKCFRSVFTGKESFIADHRINGRKVLAAATCLEWVRAALEKSAFHADMDQAVLQIGPCTWLKPIVVAAGRDAACIRVFRETQDAIAFEVYSQPAQDLYPDSAVVHAEGVARIHSLRETPWLNLRRLRDSCQLERRGPAWCYETWQSLGVEHGPSYRGIEEVWVGQGQALARIALPMDDDFVLNPGTLDSAFQASIALFVDTVQPTRNAPVKARPYLPFAVDSLELFERCPARIWAWIRKRESQGSEHDVRILDLDLCSEEGKVCVRIKGLVCREPDHRARSETRSETRISRPVWKESAIPERSDSPAIADRHIVLCERVEFPPQVQAGLHGIQCHLIASSSDGAAARFHVSAMRLFELTQTILAGRPKQPLLIQVVVPLRDEQHLLEGLGGLLRTACLENPLIHAQLIQIDPEESAETVLDKLRECSGGPHEADVRYRDGKRMVRAIEPADVKRDVVNLPWKDGGVFLITGGGGGLGLIFAHEIASKTGNATLILAGRSSLSEEQLMRVKALELLGAKVEYRRIDVSRKNEVHELIAHILQTYRTLNGIIHAAGVSRDRFILKKTADEFRNVLAAKVDGTVNLDDATRSLKIDFFVLFSSLAALGNPGQADYAAANGFMDDFASYRNECVAAGLRCGRTLSINWPLWSEGGMTIDRTSQDLIRDKSGRVAMPTASGLDAFYRALSMDGSQALVEQFEFGWNRDPMDSGRAVQDEPPAFARTEAAPPAEGLKDRTLYYFKRLLSAVLRLPASRIQSNVPLEEYGLDSIMVNQLNHQLEKDFGPLPKTLFFEYQTIGKIADFFLETREEPLRAMLWAEPGRRAVEPVQSVMYPVPKPVRSRFAGDAKSSSEVLDIAIVGLSGRYPRSRDIYAYWKNLKAGIDCITEVPEDRWDWREYYSEDQRRTAGHSSKWGGFIDDVDKFDALFFNISPREAEVMDPQERLFLEHVWMAFEDAGYCREALSGGPESPHSQVGVYVGVMYGEYQLIGAETSLNGHRIGLAGSLASIANRVSYVFDLHGPSMTVDSMCSSSLTGLHLACQDLNSGRINLGIAGGVNVSIHPNKYLMLSGLGFLSNRGRCESFGEGGDGYVPSEGVGVAVLKRLADAEQDGDHIYGVIKGSALNHGGRTSGYTVPNPAGQELAITRALQESRIDPRTISYIEAHGTGTRLGDPIEIAGLTKAFAKDTRIDSSERARNGPGCWIGSVKSNIGHCESAAGIAGVTKVLLQMQHKQIAPSLHSRVLNSSIDFPATPFSVNQELRTWNKPVIDGVEYPRRAGISSFGAGGANAHVIIEEYEDRRSKAGQRVEKADGPAMGDSRREFIIVLSAKNEERLKEVASRLHAYLTQLPASDDVDLADLAMTLQVGREGMEERLGFVAGSIDELLKQLEAFLDDRDGMGERYRGRVERNQDTLAGFSSDEDMVSMVAAWIAKGKYGPLLSLWVKGLTIDWSQLYKDARRRRISLPTYPFARQRHWIQNARPPAARLRIGNTLHPLLHENTSDFSELRFESTFTGKEFFFSDQPAGGRRVMFWTAYLEMARAAIRRAVGSGEERESVIQFKDVIWARPIAVDGPPQRIRIGLFPGTNGEIQYEIYTTPAVDERGFLKQGDESEKGVVVHGRGAAFFVSPEDDLPPLDLKRFQELGRPMHSAAEARADSLDVRQFDSGPGSPRLQESYLGKGFVLARLYLPADGGGDDDVFALHPGLLDSVIQASAPLMTDRAAGQASPRALRQMEIFAPCPANAWALIQSSAEAAAPVGQAELDLELCDPQGRVCLRMTGLKIVSTEPAVQNPPELQPASAASNKGSSEQAWDGLTYLPAWRQTPPGDAKHGPHRRVLVVSSESPSSFVQVTLRHYQNDPNTIGILQIQLSNETRRVSENQWHCDVNDAGAFETCLRNHPPIDCVYFVSALQDEARPIDERAVTDNQLRNETQLLRLAKLLQRITHPNAFVDWYVLTLDNCRLPGTSAHPLGGGITGLAYSIAQGDHRFLVRNLDLSREDLQRADDQGRLLNAILNEGSSDRGEVIKLKSGRRYQRDFVKFDWGVPEHASGLQRGGVYVILGGSGAIGMIITRYLIEQYEARVVWIGRTPESSPQLQGKLAAFTALAAFTGLTTSPSYVQADVRDLASITRAVGKVKQQHPVITGAIFSGAVFRFDNSVSSTTEVEFQDIVNVKAKGSVNFHAAFREEPLEFMCYFSSVQSFSFIHSRESSGYAAGNTFSDTFVNSLPEDRRFPVGIMNWGYWQTTAIESGLAERIGDRFGFISDREGFQLFERFTYFLKRNLVNQVLCLKASRMARRLMRCDEEDVATLGAGTDSVIHSLMQSERLKS